MGRLQKKAEFEMLVRPHLAALYRTALRTLRNPATAEDVVQETCLRAFGAFDRGRRKDNFRAWLFRILVNLCIDHIRAAGREAALRGEGAVLDQPSDSPDPERRAISRCLGDRLRASIDALTPELRLVVLLVLVEELSYAEAAESLEVPVGTIRSRLSRARAQLQSLLGEALPEKQPLVQVVTDAGAARS